MNHYGSGPNLTSHGCCTHECGRKDLCARYYKNPNPSYIGPLKRYGSVGNCSSFRPIPKKASS